MSEPVDPWAPDPIPETLPHKPYTLPAIGTDPFRRHNPADDLDTFVAQFEREHGPLYELRQKHRTEEWAETVAAYEADPRRFARAWHYLNCHPIYYRFQSACGGPDEDGQERHLTDDAGLYELYFRVSEFCAERCPASNCDHPTRDICWAETGPGQSHDYRLDVYGATYEECILQLAHLVWVHYGNDRELAHTANHFDDEGEPGDD